MGNVSLFLLLSIACFLLGLALIAAGLILLLRGRRRHAPAREDLRFVLLQETVLVHTDEVIPI